MEFITVFRVENCYGEGPYFNKDSHQQAQWLKTWAESSHVDSKHPEPFDDEVLKETMDDNFFMSDYLCGFLNMAQVTSWFSKRELKNLKQLGYKLKKIEVYKEDVIIGKTQILIKK